MDESEEHPRVLQDALRDTSTGIMGIQERREKSRKNIQRITKSKKNQ
jgi:hypothetical protein